METNILWEPIDNETPDTCGYYLLTYENSKGEHWVGYGCDEYHCMQDSFDDEDWRIVAWAEMPAPYEKEYEKWLTTKK